MEVSVDTELQSTTGHTIVMLATIDAEAAKLQFRVQGSGCRVQGAGFRVWGSESRVQSSLEAGVSEGVSEGMGEGE